MYHIWLKNIIFYQLPAKSLGLLVTGYSWGISFIEIGLEEWALGRVHIFDTGF